MTRETDPWRIPRPGIETVPLAGLAALSLGGGQGTIGGRSFVSEATLGGVLVYGVYQALLSGLRTEALVRRGELGRLAQARLVAGSVWAAMKEGTAVSLVLSLVLLAVPSLAVPLGVLGVVGMGKASLDLFHAFWDGLNRDQRQRLHAAAYEAGVNLHRLLKPPHEPSLPA